MAGKALKASGKRVIKYSRDGAVARNLAESSETRISDRTEEAVLQIEHTDERFNVRGVSSEQPEPEHKRRRHTPQEQQNTDTGQSSTDLKFEDKTFKLDDTDISVPPANEPAPVEASAAAENENGVTVVPDSGEQPPETPQSTIPATVTDHSDDTDEIPQDSFIIENLFAEFYGSDEAPASGSKSDKFSFRQDEQPAPNTGKKRKTGRLQ